MKTIKNLHQHLTFGHTEFLKFVKTGELLIIKNSGGTSLPKIRFANWDYMMIVQKLPVVNFSNQPG